MNIFQQPSIVPSSLYIIQITWGYLSNKRENGQVPSTDSGDWSNKAGHLHMKLGKKCVSWVLWESQPAYRKYQLD